MTAVIISNKTLHEAYSWCYEKLGERRNVNPDGEWEGEWDVLISETFPPTFAFIFYGIGAAAIVEFKLRFG